MKYRCARENAYIKKALNCSECGARPVLDKGLIQCGHGDYMDQFKVVCKRCGCEGPSVNFYCGNKDEHILKAIDLWNQKTAEEMKGGAE
jgi:hypothetical protein